MSDTATIEQPEQSPKRLTLDDLVTNEKALEKDYPSGHKLKMRNGKFPLLLLLLAAATIFTATFFYASGAYAASNLRAEYKAQRTQYEANSTKLVKVRSEASQLIITCAVSVGDVNLCTTLLEKLEAAEAVDLEDPGEITPYDATPNELRRAIEALKAINGKAESAYQELTAAIAAIHADSSVKTREDFDRALADGAQLVEEANRRVEETDGQVRDDEVRTRVANAARSLQQQIDEAHKADDGSLREYTSLTTQLDTLIEELRDALSSLDTDHQLWEEEQRLNALRNQQAVAGTNTNGEPQNSPDVPPANNNANPDTGVTDDNPDTGDSPPQ